ncbi:flagellar basal body P-ring formation protein FlgA [Elioraea sp. Yellowstone]|jgi:flagella basal body P-ring formation protein FlgA|uniref:flagellar basal body P-ring formation chaperone FlgA n=1 Tax=Elioraea sp. Yellowstone TaxID=2592070 RepID=UPI001152F679|nr:flagellar basal body P-ring formation chaperone FlgA [Elioraea sp. Yellowstone]TQF76968.1 flagellar basal body P-ring formation protein FlgA [Elioraea sp. Yellowstone]
MRRFLLPLALLVALPTEAVGQAIARAHVTVDSPQVRLVDLFEHAGPRGGRVLGPAPAPGQRYVVPVAQLAAIARDHGLTLAGGGPTVVERPGRPVARPEIEAALREALIVAGAAETPSARIDLAAFVPPTVPIAAAPRLVVEDLAWDHASGRFAATLAAIVEGEPPVRTRLAGRVIDLVAVPVAVRRLVAGEPVGPGDVRMAQLPPDRVPADALRDPSALDGQVLRRSVPPGTPIGASDLGGRLLVVKDAPVTMVIELPGLAITAQGRALDNGGRGDVVQILNIASRAVVEATVIGPGRARVAPGSLPVSRPADRRPSHRRAESIR